MTALKVASLVLVSVAAVVLSRVLMGTEGTVGALLGVGLGLVLCLVNSLITGRILRAERPNMRLVMVGVIVSFWLLISFVLLVSYLAPPLVKPAALTALAVYLAYRGMEVIAVGRSFGGRRSGIVAGRGRLSLSGLSGTSETESGKETR